MSLTNKTDDELSDLITETVELYAAAVVKDPLSEQAAVLENALTKLGNEVMFRQCTSATRH